MTPQEKKAYNANYYKMHKDYWVQYYKKYKFGTGKGLVKGVGVGGEFKNTPLNFSKNNSLSKGLSTAKTAPTMTYGIKTATRVSDIGSSISSKYQHVITNAAKKAVSAIGDAASYLAKKAKSIWNFLF